MSAGRSAGEVEAVRVAAKARGVALYPGHGAAYLIGQYEKVADDVGDLIEVDRYEAHAGLPVRLRSQGRAPCSAPAPRAAMQEHIDGRIRRAGGVDVEPFD